MDSNPIPTVQLIAGGIALLLAMFPSLGRKRPDEADVLESLLIRVNHLRRGQFPVRYRRLSATEAQAQRLVEARERLDNRSFFSKQAPT